MESKTDATGRNPFARLTHLSSHFARRASAATLTAILQYPAFFSSCAHASLPLGDSRDFAPANTKAGQIYIHANNLATPQATRLDVFFFDRQADQPLDAYQRFAQWDSETPLYGVSSTGDKDIVALSGAWGDTTWQLGIRNKGDLYKCRFTLGEEPTQDALRYGEAAVEDALSRDVWLELLPMRCTISLRSLRCDFSGRPYAGKPYHNTKVYLQYAGCEALPFAARQGKPWLTSWGNPGYADTAFLCSLPHPEWLARAGLGDVGGDMQDASHETNLTFFCYPNPAQTATLGSPLTRLALEGELEGHPCHYPINLPPMQPGETLLLDVTLLRMGVDDPDTPAESDMARVCTEILPWKEKPERIVSF